GFDALAREAFERRAKQRDVALGPREAQRHAQRVRAERRHLTRAQSFEGRPSDEGPPERKAQLARRRGFLDRSLRARHSSGSNTAMSARSCGDARSRFIPMSPARDTTATE